MTWFAYKVSIMKDPASQTGLIEQLQEIQINDTVPTYQSSLIDVPPLTLDYGLHKLVFKLEVETGVPELPLFKKAYTYVNITKSPLVPGFIKGGVSKVTRGWGQVIKLDGSKYSEDPDLPSDKSFNFTWWCRRVDGPDGPETFKEYEEIDSNSDGIPEEFPVFKASDQQRIPAPRDPVIVNPPPGCFGNGAGPMKVSGPRLTLNTSSLVTYAQVYEVSLIVSKDVRVSQVKVELDVGVIPAPIVDIECASEGLCFPTFGGIFVNPTSRLAMRSACTEECDGGTITYKWNLIYCNPLAPVQPSWCPHNLRVLNCDLDLMTTTTTTTSTTTTTTEFVPPLPPVETIATSTFTENGTTYVASQGNGSIIVSNDDPNVQGKRRKRALAVELGETEEQQEETFGPVQLIPDKIPTGCKSVFTAGLEEDQFSLSTDFFSMNKKLKEFEIELNITRCVKGSRKTSCSSGIATVNVKVNDPPAEGSCSITNLGFTEVGDFVNPGYNTALLDVFHIKCGLWKDPNQHALTKYVFKGELCLFSRT